MSYIQGQGCTCCARSPEECVCYIIPEIYKLRAENKRLREALKFYADDKNYKSFCKASYRGNPIYEKAPVEDDKGKLAKQALEGNA
jgi:hypothetical protein